jgi:hypothetical protein
MEYRTLSEWPFEQAMEEQKLFSDPQRSYRGPLFRFLAFRNLEQLEAQYNSDGDVRAILRAVAKCAHNDITMPSWLAVAFLTQYRKVTFFKLASWDDAFGVPHPKGTHLSARRKKRNLEFAVYNTVKEMLSMDPTLAIDKTLFETVGSPLGLGATLAEEYYYSVKKQLKY